MKGDYSVIPAKAGIQRKKFPRFLGPRLRGGDLIFFLVSLAVIILDRATKWWACRRLAPASSIPLFPFFHLTYSENTGAAFGMFRGSNTALGVVALALLALLIYLWRCWPVADRISRLGLAFVAGGAVGNLYDRLAYGHVIDFLDFRVWPVFNVADSSISVGAVCLALGMYFKKNS